jgi:hypothetical protein
MLRTQSLREMLKNIFLLPTYLMAFHASEKSVDLNIQIQIQIFFFTWGTKQVVTTGVNLSEQL